MAPVRMYRTRKAAPILDVAPNTLLQYIRDGRVNVIRFSRRAIRISETELLRIQREGFLPKGAANAETKAAV